jgi:hypothetical protein
MIERIDRSRSLECAGRKRPRKQTARPRAALLRCTSWAVGRSSASDFSHRSKKIAGDSWGPARGGGTRQSVLAMNGVRRAAGVKTWVAGPSPAKTGKVRSGQGALGPACAQARVRSGQGALGPGCAYARTQTKLLHAGPSTHHTKRRGWAAGKKMAVLVGPPSLGRKRPRKQTAQPRAALLRSTT